MIRKLLGFLALGLMVVVGIWEAINRKRWTKGRLR